jgi:monofunctional biosynthetic peptidoglycan transglycosylase
MSVLKNVWQKIKKVFLILFIAQFVYIIILRWVFPPITVTQLTNWIDGNGLARDYVSWEEISPEVKLAVMASEDQLFPVHNGFDWKSIEKALEHNTKKPKRIRGASTISQQVAKNVFLWNGRSWIRKGMEVYFTFMIELVWGKQRILEVYLNVAEMGKGVFGVEAAARKNFKKSAKKLTRSEAAKIAACLPNPKKYSIKPLSSAVQRRAPWIEIQMANIGPDDDVQYLLTGEHPKLKVKSGK